MKTKSLLTQKSLKLIQDRLKAKDNTELVNRDYNKTSSNVDFNREDAKKYANRNRGSVRIFRGNFYTRSEYEEFVEKALSIELP
jgi:hypothetical protein